jgi:FMN hydrolase / 5-amino-6-(5-phospho-D-ribitylamino)uracil phosphatase
MSRKLTVVTFDLDNTLWDVAGVIRAAERDMRDWLARHAPDATALVQRDGWASLRAHVLSREPGIGHDLTALRLAVLFEALTRAGYGEREARRLSQAAFDVFLDARHKVVYFDGALDLLETLARDYRIGALSNGNADVIRLGLESIFSFKFSAADVGASKPAPQMFRAALDHAGIAPAQMVHIGDDPLDDIEGAGRLGIASIWVNFSGAAYPAGYRTPTMSVRRLTDIAERLREHAESVARSPA